jgi:hypothetical protein
MTDLIMRSQVNEDQFICHEHECKEPIPPQMVQALVPAEIYGKYAEFTFRDYAEADLGDEFIKYCPFPGCEFAAAIPKTAKRFDCMMCQNSFCPSCNSAVHPKKTCEEAKAPKPEKVKAVAEDMRPEDFEKLGFSMCPKCKVPIERESGCQFM